MERTKVHLVPLVVALLALGIPVCARAAASYLEAPATAAYDVTPAGFTAECWVRSVNLASPDRRIVAATASTLSDANQWQVGLCSGNCGASRTAFIAFRINSVGYELRNSTTNIANGNYHHVACTYDNVKIRLFVDGAAQDSLSAPGLSVSVAGGVLRVAEDWVIDVAYAGDIDEVRIWNYARTQAQVQSAMNTELGPTSGLVGYWRFNSSLADQAGANALTAHGSIAYVSGPSGLNQAVDTGTDPPLSACSDGQDNDGDGCTDYPCDGGCVGPFDNSESGGSCSPPCPAPPPVIPTVTPRVATALALLLFGAGAFVLRRSPRKDERRG